MKQAKFFLLILIVVVVSLTAGYFITTLAPKPISQEKPIVVPHVPYTEVRIANQPIPIYARGRVAAARVHKIASQVSGLITEVSPNMNKGALVKKGEVLARIDEQPLILDIAQKKASLAQTKLKLEETQANARVARRQAGRNASDFARFVPQLEYANSQVDAAQAALDYAYKQLEGATIVAPIDGKVVDIYINQGDLLQTGSPVAVIYGMNQAEIRLPLNDTQLSIIGAQENTSVEAGPQFMASVTLTDFETNDHWQGYVVRTDGERGKNQLLYVVAQVTGDKIMSEQNRYLVPGSFVEAEIRGREIDDLRILPRNVIQPNDTIWIITPDNRLQTQKVSVIYRGRDHVYLDSLLPPGTRVVTSGFHRLVSGMQVRPVSADESDQNE